MLARLNKTLWLAFKLSMICLMINLTGCKRPSFSPAFEKKFDPVHSFESNGYVVKSYAENGVENPKTGYAWHAWQGRITMPKDKGGCDALAKLIRQGLIDANGQGCVDNLTTQPGRKKGSWLFGVISYSYEGVNGEAHVWLIPDEPESFVNYVILITERK